MIDLSVNIAGIKMKNPIMPASGTFGYGEEFMGIEGFDINELGAVVIKGTKLNEWPGNDQPRTTETPSGMINRIGLQGPGVSVVVKDKLPYLRQFKTPVIANACGSTKEEYVKVVLAFDVSEMVAGIELNISCPNVHGGLAFGQDINSAIEVVEAVRKVTKLPLVVKLTPNVTDIVRVSAAIVSAGADAISLVNTFKGRAKIWRGNNRGKYVEGGLSGPCIRAIAVRMVSDLAKAKLGVPIIGIGGIETVFDVVEFLESGARAVQVGTANFKNYMVMPELVKKLRLYIERAQCQSLIEWQKNGFPMPKEKDLEDLM